MSCEERKIRYYPAFRASDGTHSFPSGLPRDPGQGITTVYGSLYSNAGYPAVSGANVIFDTLGPVSGVTLNTTDGSITVNSPGVYTISISTVVIASDIEGATDAIDLSLSINGTPSLTKMISFQTLIEFKNEIDTLSRTDVISDKRRRCFTSF